MRQEITTHLKQKRSHKLATEKKAKHEKTVETKAYKEATNLQEASDTKGKVHIGTTKGTSTADINGKKEKTEFNKLNAFVVGPISVDEDAQTAFELLGNFWKFQNGMADIIAKTNPTPEVWDAQKGTNTKRDFAEYRAESMTEFLARALTTYSGIQNNAGNWPLHETSKKAPGSKNASIDSLIKEVGAILMPFNSTEKQTKLWEELFANERFATAIETAMNPEDDNEQALAFGAILTNAQNSIS